MGLAIGTLGEHARSKPGRVAVVLLTSVLAVAWTIRVGEGGWQLRDRAHQFHQEWTDRYENLGGPGRTQTPLLRRLRREALREQPADPRRDPRWTYRWFEREYVPAER